LAALRASIATNSGLVAPASRAAVNHRLDRQATVQQQHLDQRAIARAVAVRGAGGGPERVVRRGEALGAGGSQDPVPHPLTVISI
jgi:hypothetical protein